jgi:hypothetical protein
MLEKRQKPEDGSFAKALGNLAGLKAELGQYDEALALQKRRLLISERVY